jgi:outer membrane protein assembly factor BamB/predicted MPP superfamily phosphohydrolase
MKINFNKWLLMIICFFIVLSSQAQIKPFRFAWLTDIHIERGTSHVGDLQKSVNDINSMKDVQFTIISGDISDFGYGADLKIAKSILDQLKKPYYIIPGNHDTKWSESGATIFQDIFGHRNTSFNYRNIQFIGFQTGPILRRGDGYITPSDLQWITAQAAASKKKGRIIIPFTHYPLTKSMSNWYRLVDLFKEYSVPVVLSGHGHRNMKLDYQGLPGVMARTNPASNSSRGDRPVGYTLVDVTDDSIYFTERNPDIKKTTLWNELSIKPINYPQSNKQTPDLSINNEYSKAKTLWKASLPAGISSAAAYSQNKIFIGDREGIMHCLSLKDGKKIWEFKTGKSIFSMPAIENNKVVFGSADSYIYCLNLNNGKLSWKFKADKWVLGNPVVDGNKVFIGASDGKFRALDLTTGKLVWEYGGINGWIETKPVIYQGKIFFGAWDNYFYALDKQSGKLAWKWAISKSSSPSTFYAPAACWPVAANGRIFIAGPDMVLTALNAETSDTIWRTGKPRLNEAIGISEDGSKVFVKCTFDTTLLAYSTTTKRPEVLWKSTYDYGMDDNQSAILEKNGTAFFTFRNGLAIAVDANDGKVLWKHKLGDVMLNPATPISNKEVLLSDVDGNLVLIKYD